MGYYLQTPGSNHNKAQILVERYGGALLAEPPQSLSEVPEDHALVCVVDNTIFEAAALAYSDEELQAFVEEDSLPNPRPTTWIILPNKEQVYKDAGYR